MAKPEGWQDKLLSMMAGVVLGVVATHSAHGVRLDKMELAIEEIKESMEILAKKAVRDEAKPK